MQGVLIRRAQAQAHWHCPAKVPRHVPFICPASCIPRSRSLCCPSKRCGAAAGERARAVAVRARGRREQAPPRPEDAAGAGDGTGASSAGGAKRCGSVAGAVALIVGTSIGSGILAVPQSTAPAVSSSLNQRFLPEINKTAGVNLSSGALGTSTVAPTTILPLMKVRSQDDVEWSNFRWPSYPHLYQHSELPQYGGAHRKVSPQYTHPRQPHVPAHSITRLT